MVVQPILSEAPTAGRGLTHAYGIGKSEPQLQVYTTAIPTPDPNCSFAKMLQEVWALLVSPAKQEKKTPLQHDGNTKKEFVHIVFSDTRIYKTPIL